MRKRHDVAARFRIVAGESDRCAKGDDRTRLVADGVADHLGDLARKRTLTSLGGLVRQHVVLENQVVGDGNRDDDGLGTARLHRRVQQTGLRRFHLSGVAAAALDVEHQVVALQQFRDVGLQRDQVGRILGVAPDRNGAGHVPVDQPEWSAKQVDACGNDRRPNAVIVEQQRLDQVVEMALVIRDVDHAAGAGCLLGNLDVLRDPVDLAQDRVERVFQGAIDRVALRRAQFIQVGMNALARLQFGLPVAPTQITRDLIARRYCLGDVVEH